MITIQIDEEEYLEMLINRLETWTEEEFDAIKKVYDEQGLGDCSCEDCIGDFIEAVNNDETAFLIRY